MTMPAALKEPAAADGQPPSPPHRGLAALLAAICDALDALDKRARAHAGGLVDPDTHDTLSRVRAARRDLAAAGVMEAAGG